MIPDRKTPKLTAMAGKCKTTEKSLDLAAEEGPRNPMAARPRARTPGMHLHKNFQPYRTTGFNQNLSQNDDEEDEDDLY